MSPPLSKTFQFQNDPKWCRRSCKKIAPFYRIGSFSDSGCRAEKRFHVEHEHEAYPKASLLSYKDSSTVDRQSMTHSANTSNQFTVSISIANQG